MKPPRGRKSMDMSIINRLRSLQAAADVAADDEMDLTEPPVDVTDEEALKPERLVNDLIDYSIALNASDLFFAVDESEVDITLRHLGIIRQVARLPREIGQRCIAYIHGAAGMRYAD